MFTSTKGAQRFVSAANLTRGATLSHVNLHVHGILFKMGPALSETLDHNFTGPGPNTGGGSKKYRVP